MLTGILLAIVGAVVHLAGSRWIDALMPPVMTGTIVMLIGFNLAGAAWGEANKSGFWAAPLTGWITLIAIVLITVLFHGLIGRLSILLGVLVGYIAALFQGQVDFAAVGAAAWFGLPDFTLPTLDFSVAAAVPAGRARADRRERRPREVGGADDRQELRQDRWDARCSPTASPPRSPASAAARAPPPTPRTSA